MSPADFLPGQQRLRLGLIRCCSQGPPGTRQDLPACDVKHSQRATPNTPAPVEWFLCPLIPTPCQPSRCDDTVGRCRSVLRGYFGFTGVAARCFALTVQGHLSREITPSTRPPARPQNGQLGSRDFHPICFTPVPACHHNTSRDSPSRVGLVWYSEGTVPSGAFRVRPVPGSQSQGS